ncbi:LutC/YkgG family protein, partial [Paenactinomyces guangxiensis]
MTAKEEFLAAIAKKLGRERMTHPPVRPVKGPPDFWNQFVLTEEEKVERFVREVEQLGGKVCIYGTPDQLLQGLKQLLEDLNPPSVLTWGGNQLADWQLDRILTDWEVMEWERSSFLRDAAQSTVGITSVDYAIADTGTLVLCTNEDKVRAASLLPAVHIALVRSEQIKTRMGEVLEGFAVFKADRAPSSIHFISGPSRSADIENDLSIGVHGPAALYIF